MRLYIKLVCVIVLNSFESICDIFDSYVTVASVFFFLSSLFFRMHTHVQHSILNHLKHFNSASCSNNKSNNSRSQVVAAAPITEWPVLFFALQNRAFCCFLYTSNKTFKVRYKIYIIYKCMLSLSIRYKMKKREKKKYKYKISNTLRFSLTNV